MLFLYTLSLLLDGPALAQEAVEPVPVPVVQPQIQVSTDLHREYLAGEPMLVRFFVENPGEKTAQFADLTARPWLVRFRIRDQDGNVQTRYNVPPDSDEGRRWMISPRSRREVLLEIPSSSTFKVGDYSLEIKILDDGGERVLPAHNFLIRKARPVEGQIGYEAISTARGGHQVLWVHHAEEGADLYLHHADAKDPARTLGDYHLLQLDKVVRPVLAQAAPQQVWDRHIYWMNSKRSLSYARIRGQALRAAPVALNFPYPEVVLVERGATDSAGTLHVPFWVPAPSGTGGELRVASVDVRGTVRFRSVLRTAEKPGLISTGVDGTGGLRLLLGGSGALDVYTLPAELSVPAAGKRILAPDRGVIAARLGFLPESEGVQGGMAIAVMTKEAESYSVAWVGMDGLEIMRWPSMPLESGSQIKEVLISPDSFGVLVQKESGAYTLIGPNGLSRSLSASQLGTMVPLLNGGIGIRRFVEGGPIATSLP